MLFNNPNHSQAKHSTDIKLIVDNEDITELSKPVIENGRTLVPVRFIAEKIGATVYWDGINKTVTIYKDNNKVFLTIDSYVVEYNNGQSCILSDVTSKIINDRTYVPIRLISNVFGIGVEWDNDNRTVYVNSKKKSSVNQFFDVQIISHNSGDYIKGKTNINIKVNSSYAKITKEVKVILLDEGDRKGYVIAKSNNVNSSLEYLPKIKDIGKKILVVALYDEDGIFIGGDSIVVTIDVQPIVYLSGIDISQLVNKTIYIKPNVNFLATQVQYEIINYKSGEIITIKRQDPQASYPFTPTMELNGVCSIKVTAYDENGFAYESKPIYITVAVKRNLLLKGIVDGKTIQENVLLRIDKNFDSIETQFIIKYIKTNEQEILFKSNESSFEWLPSPEYLGAIELFVKAIDKDGNTFESEHVLAYIDCIPQIFIQGIGPNQVITGEIKLSISSNVKLDYVSYSLTNVLTNTKRYIGQNLNLNDVFIYKPINSDEGDIIIQCEGRYLGHIIYSEKIPLTIYLKQIYGSRAIVDKDKFLPFAANLAIKTHEDTGMSAALQVAQAILETGWGQSVPVDKYTGQLSYNLFGIKGTGSNGSVISNTWEVYNGIYYRIDAEFRAYRDVSESWYDHQYFLFKYSRYELFRKVMFDSTLGAWAIKRAGYATDPMYPIKLIRIIKEYNLQELDKVGIT